MKKTTKKIKWLIEDLGLNELDAWLHIGFCAALIAAGVSLLLTLIWKSATITLLWVIEKN